MIDTHAHLDACGEPAGELIARARAAGVDRIVTIGSGLESCFEALRLCDFHDGVVASLGIHPHQAAGPWEHDLPTLRRLLAHPRAVAVGETGLDHYREYAPRERQLSLFRAQLEMAAELGKAVVIHTRAADAETMATLAAHPRELPVILHCFSSPALLPVALERRYYVSFAGNVTYPNAVELRLAATQVPADRLLAETDSPYLAPQALRGRPNEPANVVHVLEVLATVRGIPVGELEHQLDENAARAFSLP